MTFVRTCEDTHLFHTEDQELMEKTTKEDEEQTGRSTDSWYQSHLSQHDVEKPSYRVFEKLSRHLCTWPWPRSWQNVWTRSWPTITGRESGEGRGRPDTTAARPAPKTLRLEARLTTLLLLELGFSLHVCLQSQMVATLIFRSWNICRRKNQTTLFFCLKLFPRSAS